VAVFCLVAGSLVSYAKARAESVGLTCDVGFAERTERLLIALVATGLSGLGVPYVLPIGLWLLAVASAVTFGQRVLAARRSAAELEAGAADPDQAAGAPAAADPGLADGRDTAACFSATADRDPAGGTGAAGATKPDPAWPEAASRAASAGRAADHRDAAPGG
jgi:hypothetical protein